MSISPVKQLTTAMMWDRVDIGRKLFSKEIEWNVSFLIERLLNLLEKDYG